MKEPIKRIASILLAVILVIAVIGFLCFGMGHPWLLGVIVVGVLVAWISVIIFEVLTN